MSFANCDCGHDVEKFVENLCRRLSCALPKSLPETVGPRLAQDSSGASLRHCPKCANRERGAEDAEIVVVDLIPQAGIAYLVEPLELIQADGITIRHDEAGEGDGKPRLGERIDLLHLTQNLRSSGNQKMLAVVGVNVVCEKAFDGTGELPVEPVDEDGFEYGAFEEDVSLPCRRVE